LLLIQCDKKLPDRPTGGGKFSVALEALER